MVLAELAGLIALRLEDGGEGDGLRRHSHVSSGLADGGQTGADRQLAGDEVGAPRRAACLGVVVGEHHALRGKLVEVRRLARHDSAVISADVEPAHIVAHDDENVRRLRWLAPQLGSLRPPARSWRWRARPASVFELLHQNPFVNLLLHELAGWPPRGEDCDGQTSTHQRLLWKGLQRLALTLHQLCAVLAKHIPVFITVTLRPRVSIGRPHTTGNSPRLTSPRQRSASSHSSC